MDAMQIKTITLVSFQNGLRPVGFLSNADLVASLTMTYSNVGGWERKSAPNGGWQIWAQGELVGTVQEIEFRAYADHL